MKNMNMDIWVIEALNRTLIRGSSTEIKFSKKRSLSRTPFFVISPFFPTIYILTKAFDREVLYGNVHFPS